MKIWFTETELLDSDLLARELVDHDVGLTDVLADIPADSAIVSPFIYSEIDAEFLDQHPALKLVATRSTTCDHIDVLACVRRQVMVCTVPSYGDHIVPEHAFALILAVARRLHAAMQIQSRRAIRHESLRGFELKDKTLGLIGLGRVGRGMVPIAHGFGMRVIGHDPQLATSEYPNVEDVTLDELLRRSDIISLHAALTSSTYHLLDDKAFAKCRRGVVIINTARGRLIDTVALVEAMDAGIVGGVGLDVLGEEAVFCQKPTLLLSEQIISHMHECGVTTQPAEIRRLLTLDNLLTRPNVVITPHIAFNCREAIERMNCATIENIRSFIAGHPINTVDPAVTSCLAAA
jgi:D-lactate dehydrogenase